MKSLFSLAFMFFITVPVSYLISRQLSFAWTALVSAITTIIGMAVADLIWEVFIETWMEDDGN